VEFVGGRASVADPHTIVVGRADGTSRQLHGDVILIAVGSVPHRPPIYPFDDPRVWDSDGILCIQHMPPSMLVVGGGVIGCEYACMFAILGVAVAGVGQGGRGIRSLGGGEGATPHSPTGEAGSTCRLNTTRAPAARWGP